MKNYFYSLLSKICSRKPKTKRAHVKNVLPGEFIVIESHRVLGLFATVKCINNDQATKKILIEIEWDNYKEMGIEEKERQVLSYNCTELNNFHLLNSVPEEQELENDLPLLQRRLAAAIKNEYYEIANEIQKKINQLTSKTN